MHYKSPNGFDVIIFLALLILELFKELFISYKMALCRIELRYDLVSFKALPITLPFHFP